MLYKSVNSYFSVILEDNEVMEDCTRAIRLNFDTAEETIAVAKGEIKGFDKKAVIILE